MLLEGLVIPVRFDTGLLLKGLDMIVSGLEGVITNTEEWGNSLDNVQDSLGGTAKEAAGLALAAKKIGMPVEGAVSLINRMTKGLENAKGELGPTGKLLESMGIQAFDSSGKIRPFSELIGEVSTKIAAMPDGLDKTNLEMQLFGRSGAEAGDLMAQLANGGMQAVIDQAANMGLAIDPAMVKSYEASWQTLQMTLQGIGIKIGASLLPKLQAVVDWATGLGQRPEVTAFVDGAIKDLGKFTDWLTNTGVPKVIEFVGAVNTNFQKFQEGAGTASTQVGIHWQLMLDNIGKLIDDTFGTKGTNLVLNWQNIGTTAAQAVDIAFFGIAQAVKWLDTQVLTLQHDWAAFKADLVKLQEIQDAIWIMLNAPLLAAQGIAERIVEAFREIFDLMDKIGQMPTANLFTGGAAAAATAPPTGTPAFSFDYNLFAQILAAEIAKLTG